MKNIFSQNQNQKPAFTAPPDSGKPSNGREENLAPSTVDIAHRAYFIYVNEGSPSGRDVQHWLAAEAELAKEREPAEVANSSRNT